MFTVIVIERDRQGVMAYTFDDEDSARRGLLSLYEQDVVTETIESAFPLDYERSHAVKAPTGGAEFAELFYVGRDAPITYMIADDTVASEDINMQDTSNRWRLSIGTSDSVAPGDVVQDFKYISGTEHVVRRARLLHVDDGYALFQDVDTLSIYRLTPSEFGGRIWEET